MVTLKPHCWAREAKGWSTDRLCCAHPQCIYERWGEMDRSDALGRGNFHCQDRVGKP